MIPQNIKSEIDKYKSRIPTDEELTTLLDLVNSTKLKGHQQEEVWDYFEKVQKEAEASLKAKEQETIEKQKRKEQEERERRIQQAKLAAKKEKEKEERDATLIGVGVSALVPFGGALYIGKSLSDTLMLLGFLGIIPTLLIAFENRGLKKVAFRLLLLALFYLVLGVIGFFMLNKSVDKSVTESEKVSNVTIDSIDTATLQNLLTNEFGQDYSFYIETPEVGRMRIGDKDVYVNIKVTENSTQKKGDLYVLPSSEGKTEVWKDADVASMSSGYKIENAISEWAENNIR